MTAFAGPRTSVVVAGSGWTRPLPEPTTDVGAHRPPHLGRRTCPARTGPPGPRDGVVRPLVHVRDGKGLARACPLLEIDRLRGPGRRGRGGCSRPPTPARRGGDPRRPSSARSQASVELDARPIRAAVDPGEPVRIRVSVRRPGARAGGGVRDPGAREGPRRRRGGSSRRARSSCWGPPRSAPASSPSRPARPSDRASTTRRSRSRASPGRPRTIETGFWVKDAALLASGPRLSVSRDWLRARRARAADRRHDLHGLRRAPQVPVRAQPARLGPRLRAR